MLLRATSPLLDWTGKADISAEHPASSYGKPVLLINGKPVGPMQADWAGYKVLDATADELELLDLGDYHFDRKSAEES